MYHQSLLLTTRLELRPNWLKMCFFSNCQMYHKVARLNQTLSSIQLAPWLDGFINVHGLEQAMKFLSNVGVVGEKKHTIKVRMNRTI